MADSLFNLTVVGDKALVMRLNDMGPSVMKSLRAKVQALTILLQAHIVRDKLHGQVLHQRSGALARSIQRKVEATMMAVFGIVFSAGDVKYAAIHEFGGKTPPHDIYPTKAEALHFVVGGREIFAKVVHHPGSVMPERSFMRSSLRDEAPTISAQLRAAVLEGIRKDMGLAS